MSVLLVDLCSGSRDDWEQTFLLARALQEPGVWPGAGPGGKSGAKPDVWLACPKSSVLAVAANSKDIPLIELEDASGLGLWWTLSRLVKERKVSVLHTLSADAFFLGALLRRRSNPRTGPRTGLCHVHTVRTMGQRDRLPGRVAGWASRRADALAFPSEALRWQWKKPAVEPGRLRVIPPAWDQTLFSRRYPRRERPQGGNFVFLAVGPLAPASDMRLLLQAMAQLQDMAAHLPPWEVRIAGEGPLFQSLLDEAENLGVQDRLALLGRQERESVLAGADVLISPSAEGEGDMPLLLDAWGLGLPVACTTLPAYAELCEDGTSCLLSSPGNPAALAGMMLRLLSDAKTRASLAAGGKAALARFTPGRAGAAHAALYNELGTFTS